MLFIEPAFIFIVNVSVCAFRPFCLLPLSVPFWDYLLLLLPARGPRLLV